MKKFMKVVIDVASFKACSHPDGPAGRLPAGAILDSWTNNSFLSSPMNNYVFLSID